MSDKNGTVNCGRPGCNKEIPAASAAYIENKPYCPGECADWVREFSRKMALISNPLGHPPENGSNMFKSEKLNNALGLRPTKYRTHL
jgi:hypothetical protein